MQEIGFCKYIHDAAIAKAMDEEVKLMGDSLVGVATQYNECKNVIRTTADVVQPLSQDQRRAGRYYHHPGAGTST